MLADAEWALDQREEKQNEELINMSRQILELTQQVHGLVKRSDTV